MIFQQTLRSPMSFEDLWSSETGLSVAEVLAYFSKMSFLLENELFGVRCPVTKLEFKRQRTRVRFNQHHPNPKGSQTFQPV